MMFQVGSNSSPREYDNGLPWLMFVVGCWAASVEVFLRARFGKNYLGLQAAAVVLLIPLYCSMCAPCDVRPMMFYLYAYLGMAFVHRCGVIKRQVIGETPIHTRYNGWPFLLNAFPKLTEATIKRFVEPICVFCLGLVWLQIYRPLGGFWIVASICLLINSNLANWWQQMRAEDMYDAVVEHEDIADRFREMRGDQC